MLIREDGHRLSQARRSLRETTQMSGPAYAGAAYMQLFKGEGKGRDKGREWGGRMKI